MRILSVSSGSARDNAHPASASAIAFAMFCGWLPLIIVNAYFVFGAPVDLDWQRRALHHAYDAGQILGLGLASWLLARALWRLSRWPFVACLVLITFAAHYALMGADLDSFLERHPDSQVPWRLVFALASTCAVMGCLVLGRLVAMHWLRWLGVAAGVGSAVVNHLVLKLDYPGTHFILAWCAAALIGASSIGWLANARWTKAEDTGRAKRLARAGLIACALAAIASYTIVPRAVLRSALLTTSGAVAAPFITRAWLSMEPSAAPVIDPEQAQWFKPRRGLPAIPPEVLPGAPAEPVIILITVDSLRFDVVERRKYMKSVRNFRAMKKASLRFTHAWSPAAYTMASLRSLFQGVYYVQQGRGTRNPDLAALLKDRGVHTVYLRTHGMLAGEGSVVRGFAEELTFAKRRQSSSYVVDKVLARLDEHKGGPLFIYAHTFDPHAPYDLGGKTGSQFDRYVAEVSGVDKALGRLREGIAKHRLKDSVYLFVTADHAEAFGEHGRNFHGTTNYEEMISIPLYLEGPGIKPHRVKQSVSLIDLGPTILSLFGAPTPASFYGQSLVPFMRGESPRLTRPLAVDGGRKIRAMLFEERYKAIVDVSHGTKELYDLQRDPGEKRNLAEEPFARAYFAALDAFFKALKPPAEHSDK